MEQKTEEITTEEEKDPTKASPSKVSRVMNKLFDLYASSETFLSSMAQKFPDEERAIILKIFCDPETVTFGSKISNGNLLKFSKEEYEQPPKITIYAILRSKHFIQILSGYDDWGAPYDVDYAWATGDLVFQGERADIHRQILSDMFHEFRYLLKL